jgi:hypothetical protein
MKALGYIHDPNECARVRDLLAAHGIPTYREAIGRNPYRGVLFVCINQQFEDAVAVLKNPNHVVAEPVDVEEFNRAAQTQGLGAILWSGLAILAVLVLVVGALAAFHYFGTARP